MEIFYFILSLLLALPLIFLSGYGVKYITFGVLSHFYRIKVVKYNVLFAFLFGLLYLTLVVLPEDFYSAIKEDLIDLLLYVFELNFLLQIFIGIIIFLGGALLWGFIRYRIFEHILEYLPEGSEPNQYQEMKEFIRNSLIILAFLIGFPVFSG